MTDKARRRDGSEMTMRDLLRSVRHLLWGVVLGGTILGGAVVWGFIRQDRINERLDAQQDQMAADRLEAREARCRKDDEDNAKVRRSIVDGGLTTGTTSGEAIITISQQTGRAADPAVVDAYRKVQVKLLRPALEGIANTFPSYRWDPVKQVCVEVPMDTGG